MSYGEIAVSRHERRVFPAFSHPALEAGIAPLEEGVDVAMYRFLQKIPAIFLFYAFPHRSLRRDPSLLSAAATLFYLFPQIHMYEVLPFAILVVSILFGISLQSILRPSAAPADSDSSSR
jgi:hypothetical protein